MTPRSGHPHHQFRLLHKLRRNRHQHKQRPKLHRGAIVAAGFVVTAAGLVMLVTPGPAFVLIPLGLYLLALEFEWAERLLERALRHADKAVQSSFVKGVGRFVKEHPRLTAALVALFISVVGAFVASLFAFDVIGER